MREKTTCNIFSFTEDFNQALRGIESDTLILELKHIIAYL